MDNVLASELRFGDDVAAIIARRHDQGADFWTSPDRRLIRGSPFSTIECVRYLLELGVDPATPVLAGAIGLILDAWREDGRFGLYPGGSPLPCQTAVAASTLCRAGLADDPRLRTTFEYLLGSRWQDSGWRCTSFPYGHGPETEHSNPHPTLQSLDAFRFSDYLNQEPALDGAVEFLLSHWDIKLPIGPCRYGIGTLFMQPEYPFRTYNLFYWVYVLSFYDRARRDHRFHQAFSALEARTVDGQLVVERVVPKLGTLSFCAKGRPSELATHRYREILANLAHHPPA